MKVIFFAAILFTVNGLSEHEQWQSFKNEHGKSYGIVEERLRLQIFKDNLKKIEHHNARYEKGESKYYLGVTKFADLTEEEFSEWLRLQVPLKPKMKTSFREIPKNVVLPDAIDWREKGAVLEVKDQGACGSCWAFSVTGAVEGQNALVNNVTIPLSEKQLMDCSRRYGNAACHGGIQIFGFDYVADFGLQSEDSYPYSVEETKCKYNESEVVVKIKERKQLNQTEVSLMEALVNVGPVSVSINADYLQLYEGGIYDDAKMCPNDRFLLNHAVLAVGYGVESDVQYWIVKNSWGANWGEKGYFKLHKNESICGILLDTSYPLLN